MRTLNRSTTIEDVIFDLKEDGQEELAYWLQEHIFNSSSENSIKEQAYNKGYDEGYETGYEEGQEEGYSEAVQEFKNKE